VQKLHDAGLDGRGPIVRHHDRRNDHVATVVEGDRYRALCRPAAAGEAVGTAAAFHPRDRDRPAGSERRSRAAEEIEIAHAIEVGVLRDAGRAIAGAELGAKIEAHLAPAVGRSADERAAGAPLIDLEWPAHFGPGGADAGSIARLVTRKLRCD